MDRGQIEHRAVVESVGTHHLSVVIEQTTACSACAAAQLCNSSEKKEKRMDIACTDASRYEVGQEVTVVGSLGLGLWATVWAYVVPLVVLLAVLIIVAQVTGSEAMGALSALGALVAYYAVLYALRHRLQRTFQFSIKS